MCDGPRNISEMAAQRTLATNPAHCPGNEKHKQTQPTDGTAPCGLLSRPPNPNSPVFPCIFPFLLCSTLCLAMMRNTCDAGKSSKKHRVSCVAQSRGNAEPSTMSTFWLHDWRYVMVRRPASTRRRTDRPIAARWPIDRSPGRRPMCGPTMTWPHPEWHRQRPSDAR